jgi:UDP-3-O-[3-hydroxymyristoyl] glucosamine N-acyltransferase
MIAAAGQGHVALGVVLGEGALVHESAYVDAGAVIGAETRVWHFCHVLGGAVIVLCAMLVLFNLIVDLLYTVLDKRIKLHG